MSLSDEWFAERFIRIEGRLSSIDAKIGGMEQGHRVAGHKTRLRLDKLERYARDSGMNVERNWRDYGKIAGKWTGIVTLLAVLSEVYIRMRGV